MSIAFPPTTSLPQQYDLARLARDGLTLHRPTLGTGHNISECANVAVAHTGSTHLQSKMLLLSEHAHHDHDFDVGTLYGRGIRCFVLTIRDPADRLVSAFNFDLKRHHPVMLSWNHYGAASPKDFVNRLRVRINDTDCSRRTDAGPPAGIFFNRSDAESRWKASRDSRWKWNNSGFPWFDWPRLDGFYGMLPQVRHLQGATLSTDVRLHFLCTSRFSVDWSALLLSGPADVRVAKPCRKLGPHAACEDGVRKYTLVPVRQWLNTSSTAHTNAAATKHRFNQLDAEDADFVRRCLWPEDAWLHERLCGIKRNTVGKP
jgi:hypothetical protein